MNEICNHIKNAVDNRINEYDKKNLFTLNIITNSNKQCCVKYASTYQGVDFSIDAEYINNRIEFSIFVGVSYSSEASFEISDFLRFVITMPQD